MKKYATCFHVVPLAGTWIEISWSWDHRLPLDVVPLAGTWIEIAAFSYFSFSSFVVPLAGTWIEIRQGAKGIPL